MRTHPLVCPPSRSLLISLLRSTIVVTSPFLSTLSPVCRPFLHLQAAHLRYHPAAFHHLSQLMRLDEALRHASSAYQPSHICLVGSSVNPSPLHAFSTTLFVNQCRVPGDGRGSCGRTLGRGIRPALDPLLNACLGEDATRGRAPFVFGPPRADEDNSRRYGYLRDLDRTLT
jgi:hypothetical protein